MTIPNNRLIKERLLRINMIIDYYNDIAKRENTNLENYQEYVYYAKLLNNYFKLK